MNILKAGVVYFAIVFGAGFVFGAIRTIWVVPRIGARRAELLETPLMLIVIMLGARWTLLRIAVPPAPSVRLAMGGVALGCMLGAEFGLIRWLRGLSIRSYLASRDPVSGTVYYVMLGVFAVMPLLLTRK